MRKRHPVKELKNVVTLFGKPAYTPKPRPPRKLQEWIGKWIVTFWDSDLGEETEQIFSSKRKAMEEWKDARDEDDDEEKPDMTPYKECSHCKGSGNVAEKFIARGKRR